MTNDEYLFCGECGHGKTEHTETGCTMVEGHTGPSDNMDVWEEDCDCGRYVPELGADDYVTPGAYP